MRGCVLLPLFFTGCLPGPEQLVEEANVELLVAGVTRNDALTLDVDNQRFLAAGRNDGVVRFIFALQPGPAAVSLRIERGAIALCTDATIAVPAIGRVVAALDAAIATPCGLPPDDDEPPGDERDELVFLQETVVEIPCTLAPCARVTTVTGDGALLLQNDDDERAAEVQPIDLVALTEAALAADADELFSNPAGCSDPGPPQGETAVLERQILVDGERRETARVDVTGCGGTSSELRAWMSLLRAVAFDE